MRGNPYGITHREDFRPFQDGIIGEMKGVQDVLTGQRRHVGRGKEQCGKPGGTTQAATWV